MGSATSFRQAGLLRTVPIPDSDCGYIRGPMGRFLPYAGLQTFGYSDGQALNPPRFIGMRMLLRIELFLLTCYFVRPHSAAGPVANLDVHGPWTLTGNEASSARGKV